MDVLKELNWLKVETGSLACLGCGHEHSCDVHGCAILRAAETEIRRLRVRCAILVDLVPRHQFWVDHSDDQIEVSANDDGIHIHSKITEAEP